ncbi:MAG: Tad domain-containing protein [Sphingomonas sp.]|nr:Tad domain-containing protein [Sphingomonas sp.]
MVGWAGLATDTIQWAMWKRRLQRAADSAAIAGVSTASTTPVTSTTATAIAHDISLNQHTGLSLQAGYPKITYPAGSSTQVNKVTVQLAVQRKLSFSGLFMKNPPLILTTIATPVSGTLDGGKYLDLKVTYSQATDLLIIPGPTVSVSRSKRVWVN